MNLFRKILGILWVLVTCVVTVYCMVALCGDIKVTSENSDKTYITSRDIVVNKGEQIKVVGGNCSSYLWQNTETGETISSIQFPAELGSGCTYNYRSVNTIGPGKWVNISGSASLIFLSKSDFEIILTWPTWMVFILVFLVGIIGILIWAIGQAFINKS